MRTITIHTFDELSEEAQKRALLNVKEVMEENDQDAAQNWAIDDCALFEPAHQDMVALFGENYYEENRTPDGQYGQFVFKNTRKNITFEIDNGWLCITEALEITNDRMFLMWLGIPEILHQYVEYVIYSIHREKQTKLDLSHQLSSDDPRAAVLGELFGKAEIKFNSHLDDILGRIESGIESYFDEDNVLDRIESMEYEFYENGELVD